MKKLICSIFIISSAFAGNKKDSFLISGVSMVSGLAIYSNVEATSTQLYKDIKILKAAATNPEGMQNLADYLSRSEVRMHILGNFAMKTVVAALLGISVYELIQALT